MNKMWIGISEAAEIIGVTRRCLEKRIKSNKTPSKKENNKRFVWVSQEFATTEHGNGIPFATYEENTNEYELETEANQLHERYESEIQTLRSQIESSHQQVLTKDKQIEELLKQQDQGQQLAAMQQKTIDKLTEQNQLLLETSQEEKKVGFWGRLIGQRA